MWCACVWCACVWLGRRRVGGGGQRPQGTRPSNARGTDLYPVHVADECRLLVRDVVGPERRHTARPTRLLGAGCTCTRHTFRETLKHSRVVVFSYGPVWRRQRKRVGRHPQKKLNGSSFFFFWGEGGARSVCKKCLIGFGLCAGVPPTFHRRCT